MSLAEIRAEYERIRQEERLALLSRTEEAYALHPGFLAIAERRRAAALTLGEAIRRGADAADAARAADAALNALQDEERALLFSLGLPGGYLTLHYRCAHCKDTGYVGEPHRTPCVCLQKKLLGQARATSQIDERETFETFDAELFPTEAQKKQMLAARRITEGYADAFPATGKRNLLLLGTSGLGKTFLLNSVAARVLSRGFPVKKITAYTLMEQLLSGIRQNTDAAAPYLTVPLLLIDDLGTEPMINNITHEYLFSILNERHNALLHTVTASNLTPEKLQERYGERIFSRLVSADDSRILHLTGQNLRLCPARTKEA
ncbi:MAG TPA: ATP-binding protein [Feifaniaceae bacterium]|nr:ATP-binding protein [Feifaniaceae bacterium]